MAVQIKIPDVRFTNAEDLPVIGVDALLPSQGALLLVDPTHPTLQWAAGVPAHNSTVPNLVWKQAAAALGSGTETTLAATIYNQGLTGTAGLVERTAKGGLHGIISPTFAFPDTSAGLNVAIPTALWEYTRANVTHQFYFSLWQRVTRAVAPADASVNKFIMEIGSNNYGIAMSHSVNVISGGGGTSAGASPVDDSVGGPRFRNMAGTTNPAYATDAFNVSATATPGYYSAFIVGNRNYNNGTKNTGTNRGKAGSRILYRAYMEDLTVSGRTYAQVHAADLAAFTAVCNTEGGRYYGDTFTSPTTIASGAGLGETDDAPAQEPAKAATTRKKATK